MKLNNTFLTRLSYDDLLFALINAIRHFGQTSLSDSISSQVDAKEQRIGELLQ